MVGSSLIFGQTTVQIGSSFEGLKRMVPSEAILLCWDEGVPQRFVEQVRIIIHPSAEWMSLGGEKVKTRERKEALEDAAMAQGFGADGTVVVLGGGATLDLVGFFASTFGRGVPLISLPSTLLAMADSCLGGKNGVNVGGIKNAIGTMFHPRFVLANVALLQSLDDRQLASGAVEVAKHMMLTSEKALQEFMQKWPTRDTAVLEELIRASLQCKGAIVASGRVEERHLLNIGHTVGHALEALEPGLEHGLGVAIGLYVEACVGFQKGIVSQQVVLASEALVRLVEPYVALRECWSFPEFLTVLRRDKKNRRGQPHMVFLEEIGSPHSGEEEFCVGVDEKDLCLAYEILQRFTLLRKICRQ